MIEDKSASTTEVAIRHQDLRDLEQSLTLSFKLISQLSGCYLKNESRLPAIMFKHK